jgi:hypothetical protein
VNQEERRGEVTKLEGSRLKFEMLWSREAAGLGGSKLKKQQKWRIRAGSNYGEWDEKTCQGSSRDSDQLTLY